MSPPFRLHPSSDKAVIDVDVILDSDLSDLLTILRLQISVDQRPLTFVHVMAVM
jgi:hypothetical protein